MRRSTAVVYYSLSGNTQKCAETLAAILNADIFKLETVTSYPKSYGKLLAVTREESKMKAKRELQVPIPDLTAYRRVLIGTPNWWGALSSPIRTFMAEEDLKDKEVALFCTHGGCGVKEVENEFLSFLPESIITLSSLAVFDDGEGKLLKRCREWIQKNELEEKECQTNSSYISQQAE